MIFLRVRIAFYDRVLCV